MKNYKNEYSTAIANAQYDKLTDILVENLIENFDYKAFSDLGAYLCDAEDAGITVKLNKNGCEKLGKKLLVASYNNHPDVNNAIALQFACLGQNADFHTVSNMTETALALKNGMVINNIAFAKFKLGTLLDAFELQKNAVQMGSNDVFSYNLMLYDLFLNGDVKSKYNLKHFLNMLISDEMFDYESAMVLSVFFDDYSFVESNLTFFQKNFACDKSIKNIIDSYLSDKIQPSIEQISKILIPKTCYENCIYLSE